MSQGELKDSFLIENYTFPGLPAPLHFRWELCRIGIFLNCYMEKNQNRRCWAFQGHYYRWMASSSGEVVASVMVPRPTSASACVVRGPCVNRVSASMADHWKHRWNYGDYCELDFGSVSLCSVHTGKFFFNFCVLLNTVVVRIYLTLIYLFIYFAFFIWAESLGPKTIACQSFSSASLENCLKVGKARGM